MPRRIETLLLEGPTGKLEAILEEPDDIEPIAAALVCHPHPQHGGTMHTKVVYRTARALRKAGAAVLRFHYRGVNLSEGVYDHGHGEIEDGRACLNWLRGRYPNLPFCLAGFSFGSRIALKLAVDFPQATKVIPIGYPTSYPNREYIHEITVPKVFIQSTHDEFGPRPELEAFYETLPEPKQIKWVEAKDHFFVDNLDGFEQAVLETKPI
ncbi:alpha/beta hydrolase [Bryobacter aggregatus]|uniref:alpha/beta hydrolase n=1 Tax=Bryobacter aggregatus TaxID=360054 RepID=UPI0004E26DDE|nr:alpha/beta fold hydrolase [Bryobacter aggregatus]